jgi:hypothetical protein
MGGVIRLGEGLELDGDDFPFVVRDVEAVVESTVLHKQLQVVGMGLEVSENFSPHFGDQRIQGVGVIPNEPFENDVELIDDSAATLSF